MNINDINCQHLTKPSIIEPCNNGQCSYYWKSEPWSSVSFCYYEHIVHIIEKYWLLMLLCCIFI